MASFLKDSPEMSPNTIKKRCKNFLSTLIRLAGDQASETANNVKKLIQSLIDDTIEPEEFSTQLQKELHCSPQPYLIYFLKESLPHVRQSLMTKEMTIDGIRPPPSTASATVNDRQALNDAEMGIRNIRLEGGSEFSVDNLTSENCYEVLVAANANGNESLVEKVTEYMVENLVPIVENLVWASQKFDDFHKKHPELAYMVLERGYKRVINARRTMLEEDMS